VSVRGVFRRGCEGAIRTMLTASSFLDLERRIRLETAHQACGEVERIREREMVRIEPDRFRMGSRSNEEGRRSDEAQVDVEITRAFLLGRHEVTQGEWRALMGNDPSGFSSCGDRCPVERVSWWDAVAYANARSRGEGLQECYAVSGMQRECGGWIVLV
jgi:formylglycine-generating enzyme required for sulfatase activity